MIITDIKTATDEIKAMLAEADVRGTVDRRFDGGISVERGREVSCDISVRSRYTDERHVTVDTSGAEPLVQTVPASAGDFKLGLLSIRVEVDWSTTGRTPAQAQAAIALYQELTNLAAEIEARWGDGQLFFYSRDLDLAMAPMTVTKKKPRKKKGAAA